MFNESLRLKLSAGEGLGSFLDRTAQPPKDGPLSDAVVVSADNHYTLTEDIWFNGFPDHLKDKAPRIWWDEKARIHQIGEDFKTSFPDDLQRVLHDMEDHDGTGNLTARLSHLDAEGISKEIVFPQVVQLFFRHPDLEIRSWIYRIYNDHMAQVQAASGNRIFPVAIPEFWDLQAFPESIRRIKESGFKAILMPNLPGKMADGRNLIYNSDEYDDVWSAIEESGLPICHHLAEAFTPAEGINGEGVSVVTDFGASVFRKLFAQYTIGRIFDKHPRLKVVFAEANISWIPGTLQDAELACNSHAFRFDAIPDKRPFWYWHNNCYATFMNDPAGLRLLDIIGSERVMWSVDYPHPESTFGYTQDSKQAVIDAAGEKDARLILGETAIKIFNL